MDSGDQKVAVITGGSQGIGAALVTAYRQEGWAVVASALTVEPSADPSLVTIAGDISRPGTAEKITAAALRAFGRIDTLVNDAGVYLSRPFTQYTAEDYAFVTGVNLTGFFTVTQQVIGAMLEGGRGGHVVNITTTLVDYANSRVPSVLASLTKGGIAAATRSLAVEFAARGIRVNAVSPGVIQTDMRSPESYAALTPEELPPLGRVGQISDIVRSILFLESSPYITGETVHVDGGQIAGH